MEKADIMEMTVAFLARAARAEKLRHMTSLSIPPMTELSCTDSNRRPVAAFTNMV